MHSRHPRNPNGTLTAAFPFFRFPCLPRGFGAPCGGVAQLVRALPCHGRGYGFEPRRSRHVSTGPPRKELNSANADYEFFKILSLPRFQFLSLCHADTNSPLGLRFPKGATNGAGHGPTSGPATARTSSTGSAASASADGSDATDAGRHAPGTDLPQSP